MNNAKNLPAPKTHHKPLKDPSQPGKGAGPDDSVNIDDLQNPLVTAHRGGQLPPKLVENNGQYEAAPPDTPVTPKVVDCTQAVDDTLKNVRVGLLVKPDTVAGSSATLLELILLQKGVNMEAVRVGAPFNSAQVRPGGYAVLRGSVAVEDGKTMKVDRDRLGERLGFLEDVRQLKEAWGPALDALDTAESIVLNDIATIVDNGLTVGWSTIKNNGALMRVLGPALAIRGNPSDQALQTRGDNQRLTESVLTQKEQADKAKEAPAVAPVTTVTTQTPVLGGTGSAAPAAATPVATGKSKGK